MDQCTTSSRKDTKIPLANSSFFLESLLLGGTQIINKKEEDNNVLALGGGLRLRSMSVGVSVDIGKYNTKNIHGPSLDYPIDLHHSNKNPETIDSDSDDMDNLSSQPNLPPESKDDDDTKVFPSTQEASKELELEDLAKGNRCSNLSSPVRQSGSYPRALKDCDGIDKNASKPISRSQSAPVMSSKNNGRRRVIFPSIHSDKPKDNHNELKSNPINKDIQFPFPPPPTKRKSLDKRTLDLTFNDSLNLDYFHETENKLSTLLQDENSTNSESCKSSPISIIHSDNELFDFTQLPSSKHISSILRRPRYAMNKSSNSIHSTSSKMVSPPSEDTSSHESTREKFPTGSPVSHHCSQQNFKTNSNNSFGRINSEECLASASIVSESKESFVSASSPPGRQKKTIKFDPRVWVVEFRRSKDENIWFSSVELEKFKADAIRRIQQCEMKMISSGTGRVINVRPSGNATKANFTNPALTTDEEDDKDEAGKLTLSPRSSISFISSNNTESFQKILVSEVKSVLVVDPHDFFLKLLTKGIMMMLPHVAVTTAHSANEAFERIFDAREKSPLSEGGCTHGFDLIIIEENLTLRQTRKPLQNNDNNFEQKSPEHQISESGSGLVHNIKCEERTMLSTWKMSNWWRSSHPRFALLIGMSAHLDQDAHKMKRGGADMMWGKPPPSLNATLRGEILRLLLRKRDRRDIYISNK